VCPNRDQLGDSVQSEYGTPMASSHIKPAEGELFQASDVQVELAEPELALRE